MELDPGKVYEMPLVMGPMFDLAQPPSYVYGRSESLSVTAKTDKAALERLVPNCFTIPDEPTVTVTFGDHDHVDFMAGGGYRVAYVGVSARYEAKEPVDGLYILVMWEDHTVPIAVGRETIGIHKVFADISPIRPIVGGGLRATASVWGHEVMRLETGPLKDQNLVVRRTAQKRVNEVPWLGYKHIPAIDGPPDASYPMEVWMDREIDELAFADEWSVGFGTAGEDDLGFPARIVTALKTLPFGELVVASHARGSGVLRYDRSRRLD